MSCDLLKMKKHIPSPVRDIEYIDHVLMHQNDEIIRLLKKIAGEVEEIAEQTVEEETPIEVTVLVEEKEVTPKKKRTTRKKKEA